MSRTKQLHPAPPEVFFLDLPLAPAAEIDSVASAASRVNRVESCFPFGERKIWCSEYQPSRVSGGWAMLGVVMR